MKFKLTPCLLLLLSTLGATAQMNMEVAFSLQGNQLTWFSVNDPATQGTLAVAGLPGNLDGNALAYDPGANRLLFVDGTGAANHVLYSVELGGIMLTPGGSTDAGSASSVGTLMFGGSPALFGGGFYNGSYYTLVNGTDNLIKIDFDGDGNVTSQNSINLPGHNGPNMFLGDIAFDAAGNLWVSGYNQEGGGAADDRLWQYLTLDGPSFTATDIINPTGTRYNGIFFDADGDQLYGYRATSETYGEIDQSDGVLDPIYTGAPFADGGDLTNGFVIQVVPEPSSALLILAASGTALLRRRKA